MRRLVIYGVVLLCIVAAIFGLQHSLGTITGSSWQQESMTYLPADERIKPLLLGFETTLAHYLWIRTILYFGGHQLGDRQFPWLIDMLDIITRLCPYFYPAYEFAGLLVPDVCHNPDASRILLERGMTHLGTTKWNVGFYLGMVYFRYYHDKMTAAHYFLCASKAQGAPKVKLVALAATFSSQAGSPEEGELFLRMAYESSENSEVRRHLAEKIVEQRRRNEH